MWQHFVSYRLRSATSGLRHHNHSLCFKDLMKPNLFWNAKTLHGADCKREKQRVVKVFDPLDLNYCVTVVLIDFFSLAHVGFCPI